MEIIYLKNSNGYKRGEVKEVADGYAVNYLLPQGLAVLATLENLAKIKQQAEKGEKAKAGAVENFIQLAEKVRGRKI
jgi:large subunit ribosomal protein L9